jgi:hypothetical protein
VSPGYAQEIQTWVGGWGLEGLLAQRSYVLNGIVNGICTDEWDPSTDKHLPVNYDASNFRWARWWLLEVGLGGWGRARAGAQGAQGSLRRLSWCCGQPAAARIALTPAPPHPCLPLQQGQGRQQGGPAEGAGPACGPQHPHGSLHRQAGPPEG